MPATLTRRDTLRALMAVAALAAGCGHLQRESALDASLDALGETLSNTGNDEVMALYEQIASTSRAMVDTHKQFLRRFNANAADAEIDSQALAQLARDYQARALTQRNQLLALQDDLHALVPPGQWPVVSEQLLDNGQQFMKDTGRFGG